MLQLCLWKEIHSLSSLATAGKMTLFKLCNFHLRKEVGFVFFFFFLFFSENNF